MLAETSNQSHDTSRRIQPITGQPDEDERDQNLQESGTSGHSARFENEILALKIPEKRQQSVTNE
jgi:hypothetical protein